MSYTRPSYQTLQQRIATDLAAVPAALREPLAAAWARALHGEHGHLDWLYDQCTPLACELERLHDWAELYSVPRLQAQAASGSVDFTGAPGATLLKDATLRGTNGVDYSVLEAVALTGTTGQARVLAQGSGAHTNLAAAGQLTLVDPLAGVDSAVQVADGGLTGGADMETEADWRARLASEWQTITTVGARGGRTDDYVYWAKAAHPSITGALVQSHVLGVGTVLLRPICNDLPERLPTRAILDAALRHTVSLAPVMADVRVAAPELQPVNIQISLPASADTADSRAAITSALLNLIKGKQGNQATLATDELDHAIGTVLERFTRQTPSSDLVCTTGAIFALPDVAFV